MERRTFLKSTGATVLGGTLGAGSVIGALDPSNSLARGTTPQPPTSLRGGIKGRGKPLETESADLSPYTGPWGDAQLRHLLRRCMFGVPESQFTSAQALGSMDAVVTQLLACQDLTKVPLPAPFATWLNTIPISSPNLLAVENIEIANWWFDQMMQETLSLRQKMTLLWTNNFVTGSQTVNIAQYVYTYLMTCMKYALGNFKDFAGAISIDPAMLVYLNGDQSYVTSKTNNVNENFARELMELFTLGIAFPGTDIPNYTQDDIENSARALTGWSPTTTAPFIGQFNSARHDTGQKTFLGQTGNWALTDIINIIFQQPTASPAYPPGAPSGFPQGYTAAYWACQKMYKEFVYYNPSVTDPNGTVRDAMARLMLNPPSPYNPFDIAPVMQALLTSAHFYDAAVIGAQIKSPVQYLGSLVREFWLTYPAFDSSAPPDSGKKDGNNNEIYNDTNPTLTVMTSGILSNLGQQLLNPPNVAGWPGGENWLSAGSFQTREANSYIALSGGYVNSKKNWDLAFSADGYALQIQNSTSISDTALSQALENLSLAFQTTPTSVLGPIESTILDTEIQGTYKDPNYQYNTLGVQNFAEVLTDLPEFQLF